MEKLSICWIIAVVLFSETFLFPAEGSSVCFEDDFRCTDGECVYDILRCDGVHDCEDGSDEENCVSVCRFPKRLLHGRVLYEDSGDVRRYCEVAPDNYTLGFQCRRGYELVGSRTISCSRGEWTDAFPQCIPLHCREPPSIDNGTYHIIKEVNSLPIIGSAVRYSCFEGFSIGNESATSLTCALNGTSAEWTGELPTCEGSKDEETENYPDTPLHIRMSTIDITYPGRIILYFLFDTSRSIGQDNFRSGVKFAKALVREIGVTPKGSRAGALSFSSEAVVEFLPVELTTTDEVISALDSMTYKHGAGTSINAALELLLQNAIPITAAILGRRSRYYIFILTDGKTNRRNPQSTATFLKEAGVEIYCIAITESFWKTSLYAIASLPPEEHVLILNDYSSMSYPIQAIINGTVDYSECGLGLEKVGLETGERSHQEGRSRIIGGNKAAEPWPWMAAVYISDDVGVIQEAKLSCGGSVVGRRWILTAAHCLDGRRDNTKRYPRNVIVKLGMVNVKSRSNVLEFGAEKFIIHNNYDPVILDYDIAVIKLDRPIDFGPFVRPICLPPEELPQDTNLYKFRENAFITRWGHYKKKGRKQVMRTRTFDHMNEVRLPIQPEERCRTSLNNAPYIFTERMFCAGSGAGEGNTCQGNSGGPVMQSQLNEEGNVYWVQTGVVSWGIGCGVPNTYGFYTHVHHLRNWILTTMNSN